MNAMLRWLYSGLMWLAQPLFKAKLRRRSVQEPGYGQAIDERFGHYGGPLATHSGPTLWIHAVSLGETRAAAVLVAALRKQWPSMRLLLTHGTATGRAEGLKLLAPGDLQTWQPWDTPGAVDRFLAHFKPDMGVLMETEVWPNLVFGCQRKGVPLVLANARLSDKSLRQAQRLAWLARPAYSALTAVWAQTLPDAQRLQALGAPVQGVMGNLKFDATPDAALLAQGQQWRRSWGRPVVMFASSREGEEQVFLQNLKAFSPVVLDGYEHNAIYNIANQVQWLMVPRHPQRFGEVASLIESSGFGLQRRSAWGASGPTVAPGDGPTIWLGDSLGEMALYYGLADVALLGGSFEPLGGQNLIEAAACACPVVMGPHTFNFTEAAQQAEQAGAALRVPDMAHAISLAVKLARDATQVAAAVQAADHFAKAHQGATRRLVAALKNMLW